MIARVVGVGLASPLGLRCGAAIAAARAGITRFAIAEEMPGDVRISMLRSVPMPDARVDRMACLVGHALREALARVGRTIKRRLPCVVALPDGVDPRSLRLDARVDLHRAITSGRAGFFFALRDALRLLCTETTPWVVVAGVDSLVDRETLRRLADANRVLGRSNTDGICPGEGAACLLLGTAATVPHEATLAHVHAPSTAVEPIPFHAGPATISNARGLASVFRDLSAQAGARVDEVFAGVTGERFFGRELSHAYLRVPSLMPEPMRTNVVADALGDVGAAAGAVATAAAIASFRSRRPNATALAYASSDDGTIGGCFTHCRDAPAVAHSTAR